MTDTLRNLLYLLFAVSGFSGLLYESVWSHYLKLFLGHAAYAQTLVLAIFMGGMAIGAWVPSRYGTRWKNLLAGYAVIEIAVGVCALMFHGVFVRATDLAYDTLMPALGSALAVTVFKWGLAGILILPQSILLGMTFPLMSAGLIRRHPENPGASLAMLYFTNSLGAAVGVLVGGFVLIEIVGLPGTILTAGLINILLGMIVWLLARNASEPSPRPVARRAKQNDVSWRLLIAASFLTGAASFIYEIGWIRMLSLVLGTSTHAFELMLSAFIVGLAFGGLWVRRRIDSLGQPVQFLGWIQLTMGLLALATIVAYNASFDVMHILMRALTRTDSGYQFFNLGSQTIAVLIMVPVTFCAGTTLPLITHTLFRGGYGEKSIGAVYAANTIGAIAGVFFAIHVGLPSLGLKGLISSGAAIDMALGIVLLSTVPTFRRRSVLAVSVLATAALAVVLVGVELDRYKMASGVYRSGMIYRPASVEILYHQDGKTATVDLLKHPDGGVSIRTNGKSDAQLFMAPGAPAGGDEMTGTLLAAIPLALHPHARSAANIGLGSGLTTHVLLSSPELERVDTIEIEPAIIEAARGFLPRVAAAFDDPRSHFHIDDAKSYFSAHQAHYDLIVSEPSNPWVSGVAGLFSDEFYRRIRTHLNPGGLFVQWLQLYEIDVRLVSSVMKAIGGNFSDYVLYAPNDGDLIIVAAKDGKVPRIDKRVAQGPLAQALRRIDIYTLQDFELRRIGDRAFFEPLFASFPVAVNSDFFPVLDLHAARTRFTNRNAINLIPLGSGSLPAQEMLSNDNTWNTDTRPTAGSLSSRARGIYVANVIRDFYANGALSVGDAPEPDLLRHALLTRQLENNCSGLGMPSLWLESVSNVLNAVSPNLKPSETQAIWRRFRGSDCYSRLSSAQRDLFSLLGAIARRDARDMATLAEKFLANAGASVEQRRYLLATGMLGYLADKRPQDALRLWKLHAPRTLDSDSQDLLLRLLWAHSSPGATREQ